MSEGKGNTRPAIEVVDFHGEQLEAVRDAQGKVWVPMRRICAVLGLEESGQRKKLARTGWATAGEMTAVGLDGKLRVHTCVDLDTLAGWLFIVSPRHLKDDAVREKILLYQREAAKVLRRHFFDGEHRLGRWVMAGMPAERSEIVPERRWANYSEQRRRAVAMHLAGMGLAEICRVLGVEESVIRRWVWAVQ